MYQAGLSRKSGGDKNNCTEGLESQKPVNIAFKPDKTGSMVAAMELRCSAAINSPVEPAKMQAVDSDLEESSTTLDASY